MAGKHRRKLWNEHVKLVATLFNAIAIGIIGVAVIGPLTQPQNPFYGWVEMVDGKDLGVGAKELDWDEIFALTEPSFLEVLEWSAILMALGIHVLAHVILRGQVDEDG